MRWEKSRLAGSPYEELTIGIQGVPIHEINSTKAIEVCQKALALEPTDAKIALHFGRAFEKAGTFAAKREAARLYKIAADQGFALGENNLGVFYENGYGGLPKDLNEAARLFRLAADQPADSSN